MKSALAAILQRKSVRAFDKRPVEESTIQQLKEATLRTPTAGNMVLWSVIDVKDSGKKEELAHLCHS